MVVELLSQSANMLIQRESLDDPASRVEKAPLSVKSTRNVREASERLDGEHKVLLPSFPKRVDTSLFI